MQGKTDDEICTKQSIIGDADAVGRRRCLVSLNLEPDRARVK